MREALSKANVDCPNFIKVNSTNFVLPFSFPYIVKPTDRSGSLGVCKVEIQEELHRAVENAIDVSFAKEAIIEEYIEGREISVEFFSYKGKHYPLQITDKTTTGAPHFVEIAHHQPAQLNDKEFAKIYQLTAKALTALGIENGASHSEYKITADGRIVVIEIGGRMGGDFIGSDLVRLSTSYDFLRGTIEVALNQFCEPKLAEKKCSGVYFLSKETAGCLSALIDKPSMPEIIRTQRQDAILREIKSSSDRSGYLIYQSDRRMQLDFSSCKQKRTAIIGAGELGEQIARLGIKNGYNIVGFFDDYTKEKKFLNLPVFGSINQIESNNDKFDNLIIAIGYNHFDVRQSLFLELSKRYAFATIIDNSAQIDPSANISAGCVIYPSVVIDKQVAIQENVLLNVGCNICHNSKVGSHSYIAPAVNIAGFVNIGEQAFLGIGCTITDHVTIASKSIIGAQSLVNKDIRGGKLWYSRKKN